MESQGAPQLQEPFFIRADQVDHWFVVDFVAVQPNAAVQGESHPFAAAFEFTVGQLYVQVILPSLVAGASGAALP